MERVPRPRRNIGEDDPVGSSGNRDSLQCARMTDKLFARTIHGSNTGAAGKDQGAIDIEENEFAHRVHERSTIQIFRVLQNPSRGG